MIADATFLLEEGRRVLEALARKQDMPFLGLWLEAPLAMLEERTEARRGDASDATAQVVRRQREEDTGTITWHRIDASVGIENLVNAVGPLFADLGVEPSFPALTQLESGDPEDSL